MKRQTLLRYLRRYGCYLKREGGSHSLWMNPATGAVLSGALTGMEIIRRKDHSKEH